MRLQPVGVPVLVRLRNTGAMTDAPGQHGNDRDRGTTLVIRFDLGARSSTSDLSSIQSLIDGLVDSVTVLGVARRFHPRDLLRHRRDRVYFRPNLLKADLRRYRPSVEASGYSNPWWEILSEGPGLIFSIGAGGTTVLVFVEKLLDVAQKVVLFGPTLASERVRLARTLLSEDENLRPLVERAEAVSEFSRMQLSSPHDDRLQVDESARRVELPGVSDRPRGSQPSVSGLPDEEALEALVSQRVLKALFRLVNGTHSAPETELLSPGDAAERLPVVAKLQQELAKFALGEIDSKGLEDKFHETVKKKGEAPATGQLALGQGDGHQALGE